MRTLSSIRSRLGFLAVAAIIVPGLYVMLNHAITSEASGGDAAAPQRSRRSDEPGREPPEHHERTALLQRRVAALESDLATLRSERALKTGDTATRDQRDPGMSPGLDVAELQAQRDQEATRIFAQIGRAFHAQPVDNAWSAAMIDRITEHLRAQPLEKSSVAKLECRSSLCRIDLDVEPSADLAMIRDSLRFRLAEVTGSGASMRDETGRFVIYLATDPQALGGTQQP